MAKRFKSTTYITKKDIKKIGISIWNPTLQDWRDIIEDYVNISKKRKRNKLAMFKLQVELLSDVVLVNDAIKGYIKLIEDPDEVKKQFPDLITDEKNIEYWENEVRTNKIILNALKDIGDGIAWRVFDYDRSLIYNMCVNNENVGPLTLNQGLVTELHAFGDFVNEINIESFVYHGITNFLLISDLTTKDIDGNYNFIEVKSGKNPRGKSWKDRLLRQKNKVENIVRIGNEEQGDSSEVEAEFIYLENKPKTILDKLDTLLKRAKNKDVVTQIYYSYLGIAITNFEHIDDQTSFEKLSKLAGQLRTKEDDVITTPNSIDSFVFSPNRSPWSIHPFCSEDIANILMGKYIIHYFFNITLFVKEIEKRGWKVLDIIYNRSKNSNDPSMFSVTKNNLIMKVPPLLATRAIFEGLSVDSLVDIFENSLKEGIKSSEYFFYGFEKERFLWE